MIKMVSIKDKLIKQLVNRLRKFGFIQVDKNNIITDEVYRLYFLKILKERLGENVETDKVIKQLVKIVNLKKEN
jgi:hypothetical protein